MNSDKDNQSLSSTHSASVHIEENYKPLETRPSPFHLRWIHGYNPNVGVINLNEKGSTTIFYAASNCGVLYNWTTQQMRILQGHKNKVNCIVSDRSGHWIATADSGPDNIMTVWDSQRCSPCRTIFSPHGHLNISKVALSAKHLVTLAYGEKVELHWWIWSLGWNVPHAKIEIETSQEDKIQCTDFNPENSEQIVLMSKHNIWMVILSHILIDERERTVDDKRHNTYELTALAAPATIDVVLFTSFTFVPTRTQLLVSTSSGAVLVYNYKTNGNNVEKISFVKTVKIEKDIINVIKFVDGVVVTGDKDGDIRFYDEQLRLLYWWSGNRVDCIRGLSFNLKPRNYEILNAKCKNFCECCEKAESNTNTDRPEEVQQKLLQHLLPTDATTSKKPFLVRDFIVQTDNQGIAFADVVSEKMITVLDYRKPYITAMTVHPEKPLFSMGYLDGYVELVNYEVHKIVAKLDLRDAYKVVIPPRDDTITSAYDVTIPQLSVTCLKYSPSGMHLACGLNTGQLLFLSPVTLQLVYQKPYHDSSSSVTNICFSCDSTTLALTHESRTISVYAYNCTKNCWTFISKYRTHCQDITCTSFLKKKAQEDPNHKLFTFGHDRIMAQYEVQKNAAVEVTSLRRVEQIAVPLCGIEWPSSGVSDDALPLLLVANDEHKYNVMNYITGTTLATYLGPRYDDPVSKMELVNNSSGKSYLLFATNKVIGVQNMPLDGNPYKHAAMLGHPKKIIFWSYKEDIDTLFTLGKNDNCVCQWAVNFNSVEITTKLGGTDLDPYYCLLDGGRFGWLYQEMRDLFYYIQVLCQGTFSPAIRRVGDFIPVESLPDIMRALGFFPTDYQDFVKLYLNHRPAFGDSMTKIKNAFSNFADVRKEGLVISGRDFIRILCRYGEKFTEEQASYLLSILYGYSIDERSAMEASGFSFLPKEITISEFIYNILGIQNVEIMSENNSVLGSTNSELN